MNILIDDNLIFYGMEEKPVAKPKKKRDRLEEKREKKAVEIEVCCQASGEAQAA